MRLSATAALSVLLPGAVHTQNTVNVSWGDHIVVYQGTAQMDTPARIGASMDDLKRLTDAETLHWRTSSWYIRSFMECRREGFPRYFDEVDRIWAEFDPLAVAVEQAHQRGMRIYAYQTLFDEGSPTDVKYGDNTPFVWQSHFTIDHPEYVVVDRRGQQRQWGVMEYAYPEVRRYMLDGLCRLLDEYDFDGLYICTRTHSRPADHADQFGFNEPVVEAYREAHGVDIRTEDFDVGKWRDLRGTFLTGFMRTLREAADARGKRIAVAIPRGDIIGPPYGNMTLPWRDWVREGLVDELVLGVTSGNWHYPSMKGKDRERGYLASQDEGWGLPPVDEMIEGAYGPLCARHGLALLVPGGMWDRAARERVATTPVDGFMFSAGSVLTRQGYATVPHDPRLDFPDGRLTAECWIKYPDEPTYGRVMSKYNHIAGDAGRGWEIYIDKEAHVVWRLNDGETDHSMITEGTVPGGEWFHLACASEGDGGRMRVYINGVADAVTRPAPEAIRSVPDDLHIGCYAGGGVFLAAWIDEVHLSKAPKAFEHVPEGRPEVDTDTVALWSFEEGEIQVESTGGGGPPLVATILSVQPQERGDGPPGCGRAIYLGRPE